MKTLAQNPTGGQNVDDPRRLRALEATGLLDSASEEAFDRYTRLASHLLRCPVALVSLVDRDRQFFKSAIGLPEPWSSQRQTGLDHSFCQLVVRNGEPLRVCNSLEDERVRENLAVRDLGVIAYLGTPIRSEDGFLLGSFCAIDSKPREWDMDDLKALADLAEAVAAEIRLRERSLALERALKELEADARERTQMLHMLVHDFRSPLGALLSTLDLMELELPEVAPDYREVFRMARDGTQELLTMVNQMLEIYRFGTSATKPVMETVSATDLLRGAFHQIAPLAQSSGHTLQVAYPADDISFRGNEGLLRRVLVNLVSNAIKHSGDGSKIVMGASRDGADLRLSVEDNGRGVPDSAKSSVFRLFEQGTGNAKDSFGIGLAFCRVVAESHGGDIALEDRDGGGARFVVSLPIG